MTLLEITPLALIFWVAMRLESVVKRLVRVEKKLHIEVSEEDIALESLAEKVHLGGLNTQKTVSPIKS